MALAQTTAKFCGYSVLIVLVSGAVSLVVAPQVAAAPPTTLTYQGKITKSDGTNLTTGDATHTCLVAGADTCDLRFNIYADSGASTLLRTETFANVELVDNDGIFTLILNSVCADSSNNGWTSEAVANCAITNGGVTWADDYFYTLSWDTDGDGDFDNSPTGTLQTFPSSGTQSLTPVAQSLSLSGANQETLVNSTDGSFSFNTNNTSFTSNQVNVNLAAGSGAAYNRWLDFADSTNTISILTGTQDPTSVATSAGVGSLFLREVSGSSGKLYIKQDDGSSTNWVEAGAGAISNGTTTNSTLRWSGSAWVENTNFQTLTTGTASTAAHLTFYDTGTASKVQVLNGQDFGVQLSAGGDVGLTERLTILTNGQTGLGDTTPEATLHVNGSAAQSGSANLSTSGTSATVTTTGNAFAPVEIGAAITANSVTRYVIAKASNTSLTINEATNWSSGYSFTFKNPLLKLTDNGTLRTFVRPDGYLDNRGSATVSGTLAVGVMNQVDAGTCNAALEGAIFYDKGTQYYKFCDGSSWQVFGGGSIDSITTKEIQTRTVLCARTLASDATFDTTTDCGGLPTTYTHLEINVKSRTTTTSTIDTVDMILNNDTTSTNYRSEVMQAFGTTVGGASGDNFNMFWTSGANSPTNSYGTAQIYIPNYRDALKKTALAHWATNAQASQDWVGVQGLTWESTSAVDRITLQPDGSGGGDLLKQGTYIEVVGIKDDTVVTDITVLGGGGGGGIEGALYDKHRQDNTSNSVVTDQVVRKGWGYIQGNGSAAASETVTFGITYTDDPIVVASMVGYTSSTPPTDVTSCISGGNFFITPTDTGATTTQVNITIGSGTMSSSTYACYSWIAIGSSAANYGADLAEYYRTSDLSLEAGDVVSLDQTQDISVAKSAAAYDSQTMGVIATNPGIVLGAADGTTPGITTNVTGEDVRNGDAQSVRVALAGRVPVKVSLENGPVMRGDPLTASSIPGVAMKATKPGVILGRALENYDGTIETAAILEQAQGIMTEAELKAVQKALANDAAASEIGKVMMYVQPGTSTYYGEHLDPLVQLANRLLRGKNVTAQTSAVPIPTPSPVAANAESSDSAVLGEATESAEVTDDAGPDADEASEPVNLDIIADRIDNQSTAFTGQDPTGIRLKPSDLRSGPEDLILPITAAFLDTYLDVAGDAYVQGKLGVGEELRVQALSLTTQGLSMLAAPSDVVLPSFSILTSGVKQIQIGNVLLLNNEAQKVTVTGDLEVTGQTKTSTSSAKMVRTDALMLGGEKAGTMTLLAGQKEVTKELAGLKETVVVIVTPTTKLTKPITTFVEKKDGQFVLHALEPVEQDVTFDYVVIER